MKLKIALKSLLLFTALFSISCEKKDDATSSNEELENLNMIVKTEQIHFTLGGEPIITGGATYVYNSAAKSWDWLQDTIPTNVSIFGFNTIGNDLQGNYYGTDGLRMWRLANGMKKWALFSLPKDALQYEQPYIFLANGKGDLLIQRKISVSNSATNIIELFVKSSQSNEWNLVHTRVDDELKPVKFCNNNTIFFSPGYGLLKVLKLGNTNFTDELNALDPNYLSLDLYTDWRFINADGDIFYHNGADRIYRIESTESLPAVPKEYINSLEFEAKEGPPYSCYSKEMVVRTSDRAVAFRGSCNNYPVTYHYLFKKTGNSSDWSSVKSQQPQLMIFSNSKDEVFVKYYNGDLFKWNY